MRDLLHRGKGPILVQARIASGDTPRVLPTRDGHAIKLRFAARAGGGAERLSLESSPSRLRNAAKR